MASTQLEPLPSPVSQRPKSRTISLGSCSGRPKSLRIPRRPVEPPIPPSLLAKASYLTSPHSIFRRALSTPHLPSQEDEEWLRDTVPLSWERRDINITLGSGNSLLSGMVALVRTTDERNNRARGKSQERCNVKQDTTSPMSSPPLKHVPRTSVPACTANWFQRTACIAPPSYNTTGCWPWHG
jgi:hypothetical protein